MQTHVPQNLIDYALLDSGQGYKLERFGEYTLQRPEPAATWARLKPDSFWQQAQAVFAEGKWHIPQPLEESWLFTYQGLRFELKLAPYKHIGIFPEQAVNWEWFRTLIKACGFQPKVLNLFGYTGAATIIAAAAGARVCQVDASKPAINWARQNQQLNELKDRPIRWIVDDGPKFVEREIRRKARYDAIIMDPPAFGRNPRGQIFRFEKQGQQLIQRCRDLLVERPLFFLLNAYSTGLSPETLRNWLKIIFPVDSIEIGGLGLKEQDSSRILPCSIFARFPKSGSTGSNSV